MKMNFKNITISICLTVFLLMIQSLGKAQITITGGTLTIGTGAKVNSYVNLISNTNIEGNGKVIMMDTALQNINMNGKQMPSLEISNANNVNISGTTIVRDSLIFTNGKLILNAFDVKIGASGNIYNATSNKFVVTSSTGKLIKSALGITSFLFPIGNSIGSYNPLTISNSGTADSIGARCMTNAYENGTTGNVITNDVVDASWDVTESVSGGSNLTMTASWNATDELPGFNRANSGIANYILSPASSVGWDLQNNMLGAATGSNPYSYTRSGITNTGAFAIGSKKFLSSLLVNVRIKLQGNYDPTTTLMTDKLRTLNLIPTTEPYSSLPGFVHSGSGGNETASASVINSSAAAGNDAIVDWVFVQLHAPNSGVVLSSRAALLQRDGDIVDTNGISPLNMYGNAPGNYLISVRHRNHLGVQTSNPISLSKVVGPVYDFSTSLTQAFTGTVSNPPMAILSTGVYGLWAGDANGDLSVNITGTTSANNDYLKLFNTLGNSTNTQNNVYIREDLNLDGVIKMTGLRSSINDYLKLFDAVGPNIITVNQPNF